MGKTRNLFMKIRDTLLEGPVLAPRFPVVRGRQRSLPSKRLRPPLAF